MIKKLGLCWTSKSAKTWLRVCSCVFRHQRELQTMENAQNQKLMAEYEKYQTLQRKSQAMQEEYEEQLAELRLKNDDVTPLDVF